MSLSADAIRLLASKGLSVEDIAQVAEANEDGPKRSANAERQARYRARKSGQTVTSNVTRNADENVTSNVTERNNVTVPRARVEDNLLTIDNTCFSLSFNFARNCAGEALANPAAAHGVMVLRDLALAMKEGCDPGEIEDGIRQAAAWHLSKAGPGSMKSWALAAKIAREHRDKRLNPPPVVVPLERSHERANPSAKLADRHGNYARSFAGLEAVALARAGDR